MKSLLQKVRTHPYAFGMVLAYVVLAVTFSIANPIHEATDEVRHYRYIRYIADLHQLPEQSGEQGNAQAHHPPLYYLTAALISGWVHVSQPLYEPLENPHFAFRSWEVSTDNKNLYLHGPDEAWPYRDVSLATHVARWVTVIWGAGAVLLTILIARAVFPDKPAISIGAAALIAFCPMFAYLGGAVNNDVPAGLAGAALTYACVVAIRDGLTQRKTVMLGVLFGLANLVKFNLIAMYGVIELALILALLAEGSRSSFWRKLMVANGIILGIAALICGWWYVRNTILYGEPTGMLRLTEIWGSRPATEGVQLSGTELGYAWTSLWARFSYGQIPVPAIFYTITGVISIAGLAGLAIYAVRASRSTSPDESAPLSRKQGYMLLVLIASVIINFMVLYVYLSIQPQGAMGRFVFPGLPAFAVLVAGGLIAVLPRIAQRLMAGGLVVGMAAYVLATLIGYLIPAYAIPAQVAMPANPLDLQIADYARIVDYHVSKTEAQPGDTIDVTVTWEILKPTPEPYQIFIQFLSRKDRAYIDVAQRDTYTGLGNYPSQWWKPGHIFTETYHVYLPDTVGSPDTLLVQLGMYSKQGRLTWNGSDHVDFDEISIVAPPNQEYPNQVYYNWENKFALVGYEIPSRAAYAGQNPTLTLYWKALNPPKDENFKVFIHVVDAEGNQWGVRDGNPVWSEGWSSEWVPGEIYKDEKEIFMDPNAPPGVYALQLGWFSDADGRRLNIVQADGHLFGDWLQLPGIRVLEPGT